MPTLPPPLPEEEVRDSPEDFTGLHDAWIHLLIIIHRNEPAWLPGAGGSPGITITAPLPYCRAGPECDAFGTHITAGEIPSVSRFT